MIVVKEAVTAQELENFVKFPFELYKGSKYWVPPIIDEEVNSFNKNINPAFLSAEAYFYIAYKNDKPVGRIAAIINWNEVKQQQKSKVRFGWWDVIDDIEVTKALLEKVYELGKKHRLEYVEGPMGFSNLDKVGVLTEGFNHIGTMVTWYNYPYYKEHLEKLGFVKEKEYLENKFPVSNVKPDFFQKAEKLIRDRYGLKPVNFKSTGEILPYVDKMFELFNTTYAPLSSFVPITEVQKKYFKDKYISFINPEYIKYVEDAQGNLVAFSIVMPSFSKALQRARGRLFPFGLLHLLYAKYFSKDVVSYLIGIHPDYQNKGVTAIIFNEYYKTFSKRGIKNFIRTPELEENTAIHQMWKHFGQITHARRRTYRKNLE